MNAQDFLKMLMEENRDNPNSLARKSNVPQSTIFRFLSGTAKEPRLSTFEKIARVYGVPVEAFVSHKHRLAEIARRTGLTLPKEAPPQNQRQIEWPFEHITPERYFAASPVLRAAIEESVEKQLAAFEGDAVATKSLPSSAA